MAGVQLLAPFISLTIDTSAYCTPLLRTKAFLVCASLYILVAALNVLVRTSKSINPFRLYDFSHSFRLEVAGLVILGILGYVLVVQAFRRLLALYKRCRVQPV